MLAQALSETLDKPVVIAVLCLMGFAALAAAVNQILKLADRYKDKPHPADVQRESSERYVPKPEFASVISDLKREDEKLHSRIGGVERGAKELTDARFNQIQTERAAALQNLNKRDQRMMFALGKIAAKLNVDIEPTE